MVIKGIGFYGDQMLISGSPDYKLDKMFCKKGSRILKKIVGW